MLDVPLATPGGNGFRIGGAEWPALNDGAAYTDKIARADAGKSATRFWQSAKLKPRGFGRMEPASLLAFYCTNHPASGSRTEWEARIAGGQVAVRGVVVQDPHTVLRAGDVVTYTRLPWAEPPSPSYVDVLYEDEHLVALAKPAGLQVLPAAMCYERTVVALLQQHYGTAAAAGGGGGGGGSKAGGAQAAAVSAARRLAVPAPVHRLGRGTSGLLLCARTRDARRRLTDLMACKTAAAAAAAAATAAADAVTSGGDTAATCAADGAAASASELAEAAVASSASASSGGSPPLRKIYRALVQGLVAADRGRVDVPIGPIPHPGVEGGLFAATPLGKPAASVYNVLERRPAPAAASACMAADGSSCSGSSADGGGGGRPAGAHGAAGAAAGAAQQGGERAEPGGQGQTLLQVEILTGRPHQIRIHTAAMGHPLVGDPLYGPGGVPLAAQAVDRGGQDAAAGEPEDAVDPHEAGFGRPGDCGYLLHALELHVPHPITGVPLLLRAPPPEPLMTVAELGR